MGYREDTTQKDRIKSNEADIEWFADRLAILVSELKTVKEPNRAAFIRVSAHLAMKMHAKLSGGHEAPNLNERDADF